MSVVTVKTVTSHEIDGLSTKQETRTIRYSQGWRNAEQDRKPAPRVARVISQDYNVIKQECLAQKALWEDPSFPATDRSIYPSSPGPLPFKWKRASVRANLHAALTILFKTSQIFDRPTATSLSFDLFVDVYSKVCLRSFEYIQFVSFRHDVHVRVKTQ